MVPTRRQADPDRLTVAPVGPHSWASLEALFGRGGASNGCWCQYWLLGPGYHKRDRTLNRRDLREQIDGRLPSGLLAYDGERPVGWARLSPRADLAWLNERRDLAPVDDVAVYALPCFYVRTSYRGQGVMSELIQTAIATTREWGVSAVEAYPIDTAVPGATRNVFPGTASAFERLGFVEVARRKPARPIMRYYT